MDEDLLCIDDMLPTAISEGGNHSYSYDLCGEFADTTCLQGVPKILPDMFCDMPDMSPCITTTCHEEIS